MFGLTRLSKAIEALTEELKTMSTITEQLNAEIEKIAAKDFGDDTQKIKDEVAAAITPVTDRVAELEAALLNALKAINNDDVEAAKTAIEGVELPAQPDEGTQS